MTMLFAACSDDDPIEQRDTGTTQADAAQPLQEQGVAQEQGATPTCSVTDLLPTDVQGYTPTDAPLVATNAKELQDIVNGGSEKYENNKYKCMAEVFFASAGTELKVWFFDQTDTAGATAAYDAVGTGTETVTDPVIGDACKEDLTLPLNYTAFMRKGQYLVLISANKKDANVVSLALMEALAGAIK